MGRSVKVVAGEAGYLPLPRSSAKGERRPFRTFRERRDDPDGVEIGALVALPAERHGVVAVPEIPRGRRIVTGMAGTAFHFVGVIDGPVLLKGDEKSLKL